MRILLVLTALLAVTAGRKNRRVGGPGPPYHHGPHGHGPPPQSHGHHHIHTPKVSHYTPAQFPSQAQAYVQLLQQPGQTYAYLAPNLVPLSGLGPSYGAPQGHSALSPSYGPPQSPSSSEGGYSGGESSSAGGYSSGGQSPSADYGPPQVDEGLAALQDDPSGHSAAGTQISKSVYVFSAPPDPFEHRPQIVRKIPGPRQKHYQVVFIKAPSPPAHPQHTIELPPPPEMKTQIYVLVKKPAATPPLKFIPSKVALNKPEVYFIRYKNKEHGPAGPGGYGPPLPSKEEYVGHPQGPDVGYGGPGPAEYGGPGPVSEPHEQYGPPSGPVSEGYGGDVGPEYGSPAGPSEGYGSTEPSSEYGSPAGPSEGYGPPVSEYGSPASEYGPPASEYESSSGPSEGYGSSSGGPSGYDDSPQGYAVVDHHHGHGPSHGPSHGPGGGYSGVDSYSDYSRLSAHYSSLNPKKLRPPTAPKKNISHRAWNALKNHAAALKKMQSSHSQFATKKNASPRIDKSDWTPITKKSNRQEIHAGISGI